MTVTLVDHNRGNERDFENRAEAEDQRSKLIEPGAKPEDLEIVSKASDGGTETVDAEIVDHTEDNNEAQENATELAEQRYADKADELPDKPPVDTDPLAWIPEEFQDTIDGTVAINRKGFEVLAHHYDISATVEMVVSPVETDGEYCVHKAVAQNAEGVEYTAYGEAYRDEEGHDMVRMSDTRAYKRAVSRATGTGMIAVEELQNSL